MSLQQSQRGILVLGGSSKVWRLMAPFWNQQSQGFIPVHVVLRDGTGELFIEGTRRSGVENLPQCSVVLALWGVTSGDASALARNSDLVQKAHEIACALGADRVIHASSGAVYTPSDQPLAEDAGTLPRHPYGIAKLAAEQVAAQLKPRAVQLRLGNVAGADALFAAMKQMNSIGLDTFADGMSPMRSYVAPDDLVTVIHKLCHMPLGDLPDVMNVAGPRPVEMAQIVREAGRSIDARPAPDSALRQQFLNVGLLARLGLELPRSSDPAHLAGFHAAQRVR